VYSNKEDMKFICKLNLHHNNYIQYIYKCIPCKDFTAVKSCDAAKIIKFYTEIPYEPSQQQKKTNGNIKLKDDMTMHKVLHRSQLKIKGVPHTFIHHN